MIFCAQHLDFVVECDTVVALVVGRGGRPEGEWIASRVREAALWFDNLIGHHLATDETQIKHRPSGAWNQDGKWSAGILEYWGRRPQESARAVGEIMRESCGFLRIFSAMFHESSHRSGVVVYAILRIVTGKALFWRLAIFDRGVRTRRGFGGRRD